MKIFRILEFPDGKAPLSTAAGFDNVGLAVGDESAEIIADGI